MLTLRKVEVVDREFVRRYARTDWLLQALQREECPADAKLTSHRWLMEDVGKRAVFAALYGDLLRAEGRRMLDVGGGLSALGRTLSKRHDYVLVDVFAHESAESVGLFMASAPTLALREIDWEALGEVSEFDVIVANDIFPNVDQRLPVFLEWATGRTRELRLSLTYHDQHRSYRTRRTDGDEILTMLAWDGVQTARALSEHVVCRPDELACAFSHGRRSAFANGRQVTLVWLRDSSGDSDATHVSEVS